MIKFIVHHGTCINLDNITSVTKLEDSPLLEIRIGRDVVFFEYETEVKAASAFNDILTITEARYL